VHPFYFLDKVAMLIIRMATRSVGFLVLFSHFIMVVFPINWRCVAAFAFIF
jgi:hypothetical protein